MDLQQWSQSNDEQAWLDLEAVFSHKYCQFNSYYMNVFAKSMLCTLPCPTVSSNASGCPRYDIPRETLEELRSLHFTWDKIAKMFGVSRWTLLRRVREYGLEHYSRFSIISDAEIDILVKDFMSKHGHATGEIYISGHLRALGYHIPRRRIRASINRVDPVNTALRWGALVTRSYYIPWPNSLWHIDGHHSLIRWLFVIHGCIDGKSRKIMYLSCNTDNKAETVLRLFEKAINEHDGLWPSRIRVDYGVENVLICDAMVSFRGEGRGSFIAGSSTRNQRIEWLWRDVFRCVSMCFDVCVLCTIIHSMPWNRLGFLILRVQFTCLLSIWCIGQE